MKTRTVTRSNAYYDSVTLMRISTEAGKLHGVSDVLVGMGTELNKDTLRNVELLTSEAESASPNDLMIGVRAESDAIIEEVFKKIEEMFSSKKKTSSDDKQKNYERIEEVGRLNEGYNIAVISVPGVYAARETKNALNQGMHVFLFSDNVTVEEEIELKDLANKKGLLLMGPDCGTAIINGIPLGFANRVRRGNIGIVGASGTGTQQVTTLIDALGAGVSQVIGTGGRDLSQRVGGRTTLSALDALNEDETTEVVVIISKPPAPEVAEKIFSKVRNMKKKVILCLLGAKIMEDLPENIIQCTNLEETAVTASAIALGKDVCLKESENNLALIEKFKEMRKPEQKFVRALFGGGTLCDEAMTLFRRKNIPMFSNIPLNEIETLGDIEKSQGNTFLDLGDDYFTRGKPHPMIEPSLRTKRIIADALDRETAVMLLDVELGYGCHPDPAGVVVYGAQEANKRLKMENRSVLWIAALIGAAADPQNMQDQIKKLEDAGFVIFESNIRAAELAASIVLE